MRLSENKLHELSVLVGEDPLAALETIRRLDSEYPNDVNLLSDRGAFLIDIGNTLGDASMVQEGIDSLKEFIDTYPDSSDPHRLYNVANGYYALHAVSRDQPGFEFDPVSTPLVEAKHWYRRALGSSQKADTDQRARLHVNYGNCLAGLGRTVDAITEYEQALSLDPDHPMAWGNLGMELIRFGRVAGNRVFLLDARDALERALSSNRLTLIGTQDARDRFLTWYKRVNEHISGVTTDPRTVPGRSRRYPTKRYEEYVYFCIHHELFLTLALFDHHFESIASDSIGFSISTSIDDDTTFIRLSRIINEIKEQYATARLLLFESINPPHRGRSYNDLTHYTDNLDYAVYGIGSGKLKIAFRSAFDILDKIALFINDYLSIGLKPRQVTFTSLWLDPKRGVLRPPITEANSYHLFALYDIARDVSRDGDLEYFSVSRHYLTHRYLVPHIDSMFWQDGSDNPDHHIDYGDLISDTIEIMSLVRNAVIYLIAFINEFEGSKRSASERPSLPMYMPRYRSHDP